MDTTTPQEALDKRGKNVMWTIDMDKCLFECLCHQVFEGLKIPHGFKYPAYTTAVQALNIQFKSDLNKYHIKNRLKTLKN